MVVIFDTDLSTGKVTGVFWEESGQFIGKILLPDGSLKEVPMPGPTHISQLADEVAGGQGHAYAAEVDDIRSALKYLGKSEDLVEMLPKVDVWRDAPQPELNHDWQEKFFTGM